jgi:hypothetical protein
MARRPDKMYAELPVFKYQTFDRENVSFSFVPIVPPSTKPPIDNPPTLNDGDADEGPKDGDTPQEETPTDPPVEDDGMSTIY